MHINRLSPNHPSNLSRGWPPWKGWEPYHILGVTACYAVLSLGANLPEHINRC